MLTESAVRAEKAGEKDRKVSDSGGLYLFVTSKGHKSWRYKYRHDGKEKRLLLGEYPEISLKQARGKRDDAKALLREGKDPQLQADRIRLIGAVDSSTTFEHFARKWFADQKDRWAPVHANDVITSLERDLFPKIGSFPVTEIDEPLLLAALKVVEARGSIETAHRLRQRAERVFKYARANGAKCQNPATDVIEAMKPVPARRKWPALVTLPDLQKMISIVDSAGASPVTRLASRFLGLTAQRPGMVRRAEWREIEGIDWENPASDAATAVWRTPAAKMKQELHLREDEAFDHEVPLSRQAVATLRAVRSLTGRGTYIFSSNRSAHEPMSENSIGYLYNRKGYKGKHVPHGWRSSFSTIMNGRVERLYPGLDRLVIDRFIIDLMLAHTPPGMSPSELRYNRSAYMDRRRELAQDWADILLEAAPPPEGLLNGPRRSAYHKLGGPRRK